MEWVIARYSQITPVNWSARTYNWISMGFLVADAQNVIVKEVVGSGFDWLLFIEHDVILPRDAFLRFNHYMSEGEAPIVSGLYYTRVHPSEPMVFRGRGTGYYAGWEQGELVWCDGVPTGCLLIHGDILRAMWEESEEYDLGQFQTRRVFDSPRRLMPTGTWTGTSDLEWCSRVKNGGYFEKAGWPEYQDKEFPLLVDSNIFCQHISPDGEQFP